MLEFKWQNATWFPCSRISNCSLSKREIIHIFIQCQKLSEIVTIVIDWNDKTFLKLNFYPLLYIRWCYNYFLNFTLATLEINSCNCNGSTLKQPFESLEIWIVATAKREWKKIKLQESEVLESKSRIEESILLHGDLFDRVLFVDERKTVSCPFGQWKNEIERGNGTTREKLGSVLPHCRGGSRGKREPTGPLPLLSALWCGLEEYNAVKPPTIRLPSDIFTQLPIIGGWSRRKAS